MSDSIIEALQKAIDELLNKEFVLAVAYHPLTDREEARPCGFVMKLLDVKHKQKEGSTFSHKSVYIDTEPPFDYDWHYGGPALEKEPTPFKDLLESKSSSVKNALGLDFIEIQELNEEKETAIIFAVKGTAGNDADTFTIKVWKKTANSIGYKIIGKTSIVR